ncbi:MAG: putative glycosyltransferase EpsF [Planctomycetota bacterium]|jgi:glycosyltransferase involved in cell wall biosynthesis
MLSSLKNYTPKNVLQKKRPRDQRGPLNTFFIISSMPVGGAEVLLCNLIRRLDRSVISPNLICLKELGHLGEQLAKEIPTHSQLLRNKWDLRILRRLTQLLSSHHADAVITVGAGDKMFWGRLAARFAKVPVVCSALHSTGWPDGIGKLNRLLTPWTDAFIGVADAHAEHLRRQERFPDSKVKVIPNGVDTNRFRPNSEQRCIIRKSLGLPLNCPLIGIVAALRPEKNHGLLVRSAVRILTEHPEAHFLIVGDGTERTHIENQIRELGLQHRIHMLGNRSDTPQLLAALDVFTLCSLNEANPVSILEALATGIPVVSTNVGSISETVINEVTGLLVPSENACALSRAISSLLHDRAKAKQMGLNGRQHVTQGWSLQSMVKGYEDLILQVYDSKIGQNFPCLSDTLRDSGDTGNSVGFSSSDTVVDDSDRNSTLQQHELQCVSTPKQPGSTPAHRSCATPSNTPPAINHHELPIAAVNHLSSSSDSSALAR